MKPEPLAALREILAPPISLWQRLGSGAEGSKLVRYAFGELASQQNGDSEGCDGQDEDSDVFILAEVLYGVDAEIANSAVIRRGGGKLAFRLANSFAFRRDGKAGMDERVGMGVRAWWQRMIRLVPPPLAARSPPALHEPGIS